MLESPSLPYVFPVTVIVIFYHNVQDQTSKDRIIILIIISGYLDILYSTFGKQDIHFFQIHFLIFSSEVMTSCFELNLYDCIIHKTRELTSRLTVYRSLIKRKHAPVEKDQNI